MASLIARYPTMAAIELVRLSREGRVPGGLMWALVLSRRDAKTRRIVSRHLYTILNGDLERLDAYVVAMLGERGWGRSLRRGVYRFLRRVPRAVRQGERDEVIGEFTIGELASLSHLRGR